MHLDLSMNHVKGSLGVHSYQYTAGAVRGSSHALTAKTSAASFLRNSSQVQAVGATSMTFANYIPEHPAPQSPSLPPCPHLVPAPPLLGSSLTSGWAIPPAALLLVFLSSLRRQLCASSGTNTTLPLEEGKSSTRNSTSLTLKGDKCQEGQLLATRPVTPCRGYPVLPRPGIQAP